MFHNCSRNITKHLMYLNNNYTMKKCVGDIRVVDMRVLRICIHTVHTVHTIITKPLNHTLDATFLAATALKIAAPTSTTVVLQRHSWKNYILLKFQWCITHHFHSPLPLVGHGHFKGTVTKYLWSLFHDSNPSRLQMHMLKYFLLLPLISRLPSLVSRFMSLTLTTVRLSPWLIMLINNGKPDMIFKFVDRFFAVNVKVYYLKRWPSVKGTSVLHWSEEVTV